MIAEIGVLCGGCGWRNKGESSECQHCRAELLQVHTIADDGAEQWVVEQMALRASNGLPTDDDTADQLLEWVQSFEVEIAADGRVTFVEPVRYVDPEQRVTSSRQAAPAAIGEKPTILIATTDTIPRHTITDYHGLVAVGRATMMSLVGGEAFAGLTIDKLLSGSFQESVILLGGNAAVGLRVNQVSDMILAYGTAVTVEPGPKQDIDG
ncbi:MAG: hypothetical protein ACC652_06460 [Acidimicrobiales bacterium]